MTHPSEPAPGGPVSRSDAPSNPELGWILSSTILASSMAFIDASALPVALPALQADLAATGKQLLWTVNAYLLCLSALMLVGGALGDRYGRKRAFSAGIATFALGSLLAGLAPSTELLIGARAVQGVGGALMVPGSLALLSESVSAAARGRAIGTWSAFTSLTTIIGPVLGGILASAGLWRGIFFLNLPLAAVALLVLRWRVPATRPSRPVALDLTGTALVTLSLGGLAFGAIEAPERGLVDGRVLAGMIGGLVGLLGFVAYEARARAPMVPLWLFKSATFSAANLLTFLLYGALTAGLFFFNLTLIQAQGYEARQAGLALLPFALILTGLSRWAGRLVDLIGPRKPLIVGPAATAVGFIMLGLPGLAHGPASYWASYFPGVVLIGVGMGVTVAPLTTAVMNAVPPGQVGVASGVNNAVARTAGMLAIAFMGGLTLLAFRQALVDRGQALNLTEGQRAALIAESEDLGEAQPPAGLPPAMTERVERLIHRALLQTFRRVAFLSGGMAALSALAAALWIRTEGNQDPGGETKAPA